MPQTLYSPSANSSLRPSSSPFPVPLFAPCLHLLFLYIGKEGCVRQRRVRLCRKSNCVTSGLDSDSYRMKGKLLSMTYHLSKAFTISPGFLITLFCGFPCYLHLSQTHLCSISRTYYSLPYLFALAQAVPFTKKVIHTSGNAG